MVRHIMKDGKVLRDITGHVVKEEDAKAVYALMDKINQSGKETKDD